MPKEWKKPKATEGERRKAASDAKKTVARNKRARHDYLIEDTWEAGLSLMGTEVKALRMGRASLVDSWVEVSGGEAWLYGANIPLYAQGSWTNHAPTRKRKLLLHRAEIDRMASKASAKGYTIVPLELYFVGGRAKVEIALAKGKQEWDKRQALREKQDQREAERAMRRSRARVVGAVLCALRCRCFGRVPAPHCGILPLLDHLARCCTTWARAGPGCPCVSGA